MGTKLSKGQKMISYTPNFYVTSILMYMITQNVVANIMASYPEVADYTVKSLITLPTLFGLIATFAMGPSAMKFDKTKLLVLVMCSMGIFSLIFFANGLAHGPFQLYYVAVVFGGFAMGSFAPLMNLIIGETFEAEDRAGRIASYNVTNNCGAFFILFLSGRIAAANNGANWPYAYLLGLYCFVTTAVFVVMIKKAGYRDDPAARAERSAVHTAEKNPDVKFSEIPKRVIGIVAAIGILHCVFYIGLNAYYTNVSTRINENGLGTAAQAGNATSLVRFTLIIMTFLYPMWNRILKSWMIPCGYLLGAIAMVCMLNIQSIWGVYAAAWKLESLSTQGKKKEEGVLPLITIPTIAASGSEVSNVAVIANHDKNMKLDYRSDALRPVAVFTDPTYTYTVPPFQTACGILDIMSHSYEGYFSTSAGSMQDGISETIQRTCIEHGRKVMLVPRDYDSRAQLLWAAQLSIAHLSDQGRKFVGNIHATERVVGNYFGFPHGAGVAIMSLAWFKYALGDQTAYRFARWARNVWGVDSSLGEMDAAKEGIRRYEAFMVELGVPTRLSQSKLEVSPELVSRCADEVWERVNAGTWFKPLSGKQQLLDYMMLAW